jgi:trigger factor
VKVTQSAVEARQTVLNIEIEPDELEKYLDGASSKLAQRLNVPGFRRGKAPRWMVERVVTRDGLLDEALDAMLPDVTQKALTQEKIEWSAPPAVELASREPLTIKATVPLTPVFELNDYRSLRVPREEVQVDEAAVNESLESLRKEQAPWEPVDQPVQADNLVVIDLEGTVDGEPFFKQDAMPYIVSVDSDVPLPGFAKSLVGVPLNQPTEFDLPIPENYPEPKVAGKTCRLKVTVKEAKAQKLPAVDDEFAKGVGQGFDNLDALKDHLRANIRASKEEEAKRAYEEKVVSAVLAQATVELPELLVRHEAEHMVEEQLNNLARQGLNVQDYLQRTNTTVEQLRDQAMDSARQMLLRSLLLRKVADAENVTVDDAAVQEEFNAMARQVEARSGGRQRLREDQQSKEVLGRMQRSRKALERLVEIAQGNLDGQQGEAKQGS